MKFLEIAQLFETLGSTSKRLEKIVLLRDFLEKNETSALLIFDMIAGNYQRNINKKTLGISLKTLFDVLAFVSKTPQAAIEKRFSKIGDIGLIAVEVIEGSKQQSLFGSELNLESISTTYEKISQKTGTNSNKYKKELISQLFLSAKDPLEYKFLARLFIDDLRIGVSEGVLKEACVNHIFPYLESIHIECTSCHHINLALKTCMKCSEPLDLKNLEYSLEEFDLKTPKEIKGLDNFVDTRDFQEQIRYILRNAKPNQLLRTQNSREFYNAFIHIFEKNYNVVNNFEFLLNKIRKDPTMLLKVEILLGTPLRSMLGSRANTVAEAFNFTGTPSFIDYKYDGLRVQIHNDYGKVHLFSRNLDNITKQFPEVVEFVQNNFSDISFVLDSECVGYNYEKQEFLPFQLLSRRIMTKDIREVSHINVALRVFDLMYLEGETLLEEGYVDRRGKMENLMIGREIKQRKYSSFEYSKD
jgi:ATP-dependent DNA ligase I